MPPVRRGTTFWKKPHRKCLIFHYVLNFIYKRSINLLSSWNKNTLQPNNLELYSKSGAPLQNCFGCVEGKVLHISRPKIKQNTVCNGHERGHGTKFQSLVLPNGLYDNSLVILVDPMRESDMKVPCYVSLDY